MLLLLGGLRGRSGSVTRCSHGEGRNEESGAVGKERRGTGQASTCRDTGRSDTALSEHLWIARGNVQRGGSRRRFDRLTEWRKGKEKKREAVL